MGDDGATESRAPRSGRRRRLRPGSVLDFASWLIPPASGLRIGGYVAGTSAALIGGVARPLVPSLIRDYPARVSALLDRPPLSREEARRLMRERLLYLIARQMASHALSTGRGRQRLWRHLEVRGHEHLDVARAHGQGVMLVTTHFGLPFMIRVVLPRLGLRQVQAEVGDDASGRNVSVSGGARERLAALKRFRAALVGGAACVLLADGRIGAPVTLPFFASETTVTLGAFYLGQLAQCAILPYFGVLSDGRLRIEISPPLPAAKGPSPEDLTEVAESFFEVYRDYVQRYPSHLPYRLLRKLKPLSPPSL